jgi:hypothetical protein
MSLSNPSAVQSPQTLAILLAGSFAPNGSSAPTTVKGQGYSVARVGVGQYRLTFSQTFPDNLSFVGSAQFNTGSGEYKVTFGTYNATNKTLDMFVTKVSSGFIDLPLASARILATNDIQNSAATPVGGVMTKNSAPLLQAVNAGTDQSLMIQWAASGVAKLAWGLAVPPDIDSTIAPTLNAYAKMGGASDTPTLTFQAFQLGGSDLGGATAALSSTVAQKSVTLSAGVSYPGNLGVTLVPGAHGTDAVNLYAAWLEYARALAVDMAADANNRINFQVVMNNSIAAT